MTPEQIEALVKVIEASTLSSEVAQELARAVKFYVFCDFGKTAAGWIAVLVIFWMITAAIRAGWEKVGGE